MVPKGHHLATHRFVTKEDVLSESVAVFGQKQCPIYHDWLRSV